MRASKPEHRERLKFHKFKIYNEEINSRTTNTVNLRSTTHS